MPGQHRRSKPKRADREEAVLGQRDPDLLRGTVVLEFAPESAAVRSGAIGPDLEVLRRRELHLVADDDDLWGAVEGRDGFLDRDLTGLVVDDDIEGGGQRQGVGHRGRAHQPDRAQQRDDRAGIAGGQVADGAVAHDLAELVFQFAPPGGEGLLPVAVVGRHAADTQLGVGQLGQEAAPYAGTARSCRRCHSG